MPKTQSEILPRKMVIGNGRVNSDKLGNKVSESSSQMVRFTRKGGLVAGSSLPVENNSESDNLELNISGHINLWNALLEMRFTIA